MNVVLLIVDSLQKNYIGAYGNRWIKTPNMDRLAKESCIFTNVYPESLPTLQVRAALHSGKRVYPFRENVARRGDRSNVPGWGPISENWVTMAEILQEKGCRTGLITDTFHQFKPGKNFHRGFDQFTFIRGQEDDAHMSGYLPGMRQIENYYVMTGYDVGAREMDIKATEKERFKVHLDYLRNTARRQSEEDYFAPRVFREAAKWVYQNQDADRFFLVVDSFDPHEPWDPPTYYRELYEPVDDMQKDIILSTYSSTSLLTERQLKRLRANYAGEVTMVDRWLGYFLDTLDYTNLSQNTVVIFISDHGHHLGEKDLVGKFSYPVLPEVADLAFFIRVPKSTYAGEKVDDFVYNVDVAPTVLSFLGVEPAGEMEGVNLITIMEGKSSTKRDHITVGWRNDVMVKTDRFWYVGRLDRSEEMLFSIEDDPDLTKNLAGERKDVCKTMHALALKDAGGPIPEYVMKLPKYRVYGGLKW